MKKHESPFINSKKNTIEFTIENGCAEQISLAGTFNNWAQGVLPMKLLKGGLWRIEIPMLPQGTYHYKFLIDHRQWAEDIDNPFREPDGYDGFNSILIVDKSKGKR